MEIQRFDNGLTVAELKAILAGWPDTHEDGTPCEVWLSDGNDLTNQAREVWPLSMRQTSDGRHSADLLLGHDAKGQ